MALEEYVVINIWVCIKIEWFEWCTKTYTYQCGVIHPLKRNFIHYSVNARVWQSVSLWVNHNGIKTIVTLYRRKTPNRRTDLGTPMIMHVCDCFEWLETFTTSHRSISIQKSVIDIISIMTSHMCYKFVHGIEVFTTQVTWASVKILKISMNDLLFEKIPWETHLTYLSGIKF